MKTRTKIITTELGLVGEQKCLQEAFEYRQRDRLSQTRGQWWFWLHGLLCSIQFSGHLFFTSTITISFMVYRLHFLLIKKVQHWYLYTAYRVHKFGNKKHYLKLQCFKTNLVIYCLKAVDTIGNYSKYFLA